MKVQNVFKYRLLLLESEMMRQLVSAVNNQFNAHVVNATLYSNNTGGGEAVLIDDYSGASFDVWISSQSILAAISTDVMSSRVDVVPDTYGLDEDDNMGLPDNDEDFGKGIPWQYREPLPEPKSPLEKIIVAEKPDVILNGHEPKHSLTSRVDIIPNIYGLDDNDSSTD